VIAPYPLGGLLFVYEDVTDSLALQRKNNTLLAVQKETINNLYEGIVVYGSDNRLKIVNNAIYKIWKFGSDESKPDIKGMHISEVLDCIKDELDYGENWDEFRGNAISNLTDRIVKTGKLIKKDGSIILCSYIPLPDGAHMHSFIDITDTCVVEKAVMEKNQALKAAQELRFEFVSGISVELKEPLNILIGFTELLFHQYFGALNEKQLEYCQCILRASNQLHQLINDLLEMFSIDIDSPDLDISLFSIKEAVDEVISNLEKRINERNIDINKIYPEEDVKFNGDKIRIKQSIYHIMVNTIQVTPQNGKIDVIIAIAEDNLKILIKDEGVKSGDEKIYFLSSKKSFSANNESGNIAMPFVRSLIESHGGTLRVNFDAEDGTRVICTLPFRRNKTDPETPDQNQQISGDNLQEVVNS
jgi:nitrogen-specific signal transduction histidine kinase